MKKIIYIIKKGLQAYPPCMAQVFMLNDLGVKIEVYHGKNTSYINDMLEKRKIVHHTFYSDKDSRGKFDSAMHFLTFKRELSRIFKQLKSENNIFWIGNAETAIAIESEVLKKEKYILNVLELYNEGTFIEKRLRKIQNDSISVICCEKHRAAIMECRYGLKNVYVMPNKPYELKVEDAELDLVKKIKGDKCKYIIYQGIVSRERPLENIIAAIEELGGRNFKFLILGNGDKDYIQYLTSLNARVLYGGYIPAPKHLIITKLCHIGIAFYEKNKLNNIFCAPNKIYEYSCFGLPMIASNCISLEETVGMSGAGICVDFSSIDEIRFALEQIETMYEAFSQQSTEFYKSVDNCSTMMNIIKELEKQ